MVSGLLFIDSGTDFNRFEDFYPLRETRIPVFRIKEWEREREREQGWEEELKMLLKCEMKSIRG